MGNWSYRYADQCFLLGAQISKVYYLGVSTAQERLHSIVVPVFNGGPLLEEALLSLFAQTYPRIEIIVVNDGSTDATTLQILEKYQDQITTIHKKNGGTGSALNVGLNAASGDFLHWLSHDDLYFPTRIAAFDDEIGSHKNFDRIVCLGSWKYIDLSGNLLGALELSTVLPTQLHENPYWPLLLGVANGCAISFSRSLFEEVGKFREDLLTTQDYDYWLRLFPVAELRIVDGVKVAHRLHEGQGSRTISTHTEEADDFYCKLLTSLAKDFSAKLSLSPLVSLSRIREHLAPSQYNRAKLLTQNLIQKFTTDILTEEGLADTWDNRQRLDGMTRLEYRQVFGSKHE